MRYRDKESAIYILPLYNTQIRTMTQGHTQNLIVWILQNIVTNIIKD